MKTQGFWSPVRAAAVTWGLLAQPLLPAACATPADEPTAIARQVAKEIVHEATLPPRGPGGRPLPLASHWNVGTVRGTFELEHQIGWLQKGHHILPWLAWPDGDPGGERFDAYFGRALRYCAELGLPISFRGTQWNAMLVGKSYREGPASNWAGVIAPDGSRVPRLSPFGPVEPWKACAEAYINTAAMRRVQQLYPHPPLVLLVSNNEPPDLRWAKHGSLERLSRRYLDRYGAGRPDEFKRRVVGEGWVERYRTMFKAMREALAGDTWKKNVRFVGYDAFGPAHLGRWNGWKVYSLVCDRWTSPDWHCWDGGSPSYYTDPWHDKRDDQVFSTQVAAMNWVFMLDEAWEANPRFWFEMSTWDGNEVKPWLQGLAVTNPADLARHSAAGLSAEDRRRLAPEAVKRSKALQYIAEGQTYPPERAAGWVQYGMWLVRPRVVREFRGHATALEPVAPYWMETVKAVDRVYAHAELAEFWRHGTLVPNRAHPHPYDADLPHKFKTIHRWHSLDTHLDPPRPWHLNTPIPVFSLALVRGVSPGRRWLLYAHSPAQDRAAVRITIPGYGDVVVDVPRRGVFCVVEERTGEVRRLATRFSTRRRPERTVSPRDSCPDGALASAHGAGPQPAVQPPGF
ncbi:MAG: hypothetical protein JXQ71_02620 [Verrucomicrobia bacterium]|nr:hypothetical protein [Verrucomicrobiota bacterium]